LRLFREEATLNHASLTARTLLSGGGLSCSQMSSTQVAELGPAIAPIASELAEAIHYKSDEVGDAHQYCVALADFAHREGVELRFRREVSSFERRVGRVTAACCGLERLIADRFVIAAGSYSTPLLRQLGITLPVRPAKGYSITYA
jgi:D-amino-acid dehydrogenase